ncbi:MAG: hypothetical protein ACI9V1_000075 [Spirosomataceae bacterium]|jgi:hypothetical protein
MKKVSLYVSFLAIASLSFLSCEKEEVFTAPSVTLGTLSTEVPFAAKDQTVTFNVAKDPNVSANYITTATGVTVKNPSGTIVGNTVSINFDAGTTAGAGSITLDITDSQGQKSSATYVITIVGEVKVFTLTTNISTDATWETGKTYILGGRITVTSGATLTIQPGVIIKGRAGIGANATALLIARGAKLNANGTATLPIIFTSVADEISPEDIAAGRFVSPNLAPTINGLWGGVIVLGKAKISASNASGDVSEAQIEGIPTSDQNGLYGGIDDADNSGSIKYVSIRHGGANIGNGNEINGLTLGGVGSGTVIENIEIVANQDDGIEFFGGKVSVKNAVVWNVGDDAIDTDQSWSGTLDNFAIITPEDHNFELDGPEGSYAAGHQIMNGWVNAANAGDLINTDANSIVDLKSIYFKGVGATQVINRVTAPRVTFTDIFIDVLAVNLANNVNGAIPAGVKAGKTNTADLSKFNWTWAAKADVLK